MADRLLSPELDYKPANYRHGSKTFTNIVQQTGGNTVVIPAASTIYSDFEIPIKALYLSDSYIRGVVTPAGPGAGFYNWLWKQSHFITEIHLMTRGGVFLTQLYFADRYRSLTRGFHVPMEDFLAADDVDRFCPSRASGLTADVGGRPTGTALPASAPYTELQYAERGDLAARTPTIPFTIRLGDFHDTIFGIKKALLFPEIVIVRVTWGPVSRFSWKGTDPTDATAGAVAAGDMTVNNMSLYLAIENDPEIVQDLLTHQAGNNQLAVPWVYSNRQSPAASTYLALTVKVTPDMGFMVGRMIYGLFPADETKYNAQDHSNLEGVNIGAYQTMLDSLPRQTYPVSCGGAGGGIAKMYDDWKLHARLCRGTSRTATFTSTIGSIVRTSPISVSAD
jgi:hypothetical protein